MSEEIQKPLVVRSHDTYLDFDYVQWIYDVKQRFRNAQIKATVKANSEQLLFNWQMGRDLVTRKLENKGWANFKEFGRKRHIRVKERYLIFHTYAACGEFERSGALC